MGRTSLRPWFMGNKMQFEAVACRLFLHYSYTLAQKASNYGIFCFYDTNTVWEDFITLSEYNITKDGAPFLSMGVSIKYAEQFKDMLYFLSYYKIERCLVSYIDRINRVCDIIKTLE